jgi:hypothetical protein
MADSSEHRYVKREGEEQGENRRRTRDIIKESVREKKKDSKEERNIDKKSYILKQADKRNKQGQKDRLIGTYTRRRK